MPTLKSYPHYEINVKDNSIQTVSVEEILPVHRPIYVLPTQEGPVGEPVWCENASKLMKIFGEQTLNMANKKFATRPAFYLLNTMSYNGAFVVRALPDTAKTAYCVLVAYVTKNADIDQFKIEDGKRVIDLNATIKNKYGQEVNNPHYGEYELDTETKKGVKIQFGTIKINASSSEDLKEQLQNIKASAAAGDGFTSISGATSEFVYTAVADQTNAFVNNVNGDVYYIQSGDGYTEATTANVYLPAGTTVYDSNIQYYTVDQNSIDGFSPVGTSNSSAISNYYIKSTLYTKTQSEGTSDLPTQMYPILAVAASNDGAYGSDLGFRFFYKESENDSASVQYYKTVFNSFSVVRRDYNSSTTNVVLDIYGRKYTTFAADPDCVDPETGIKSDMDSVLTNAFDTDNADGTVFPYTVYTYEDQIKAIAKIIIDAEYAAYEADGDYASAAKSLGFDELGLGYVTEDQFKENINELKKHPFMINVLSCKNLNGVRYNCAEVIDNETSAGVKLNQDVDIFLNGGSDGTLDADIEEEDRDNWLDEATYKFFKLYTNDHIVDKFRYPITHVYDVGYSMTTKYALIDFLDIRDDVMVELSTQVCMPNKWIHGENSTIPSTPIKINSASSDIMNGLILRERALLMRESVLKGTGCMRCAIYAHTGKPIAPVYSENVPFTFWSAMKHAQYGNTSQMSIDEPRGLPFSYNELFYSNTWNWINYSENIKEKTWNAGINYCQYADMTRIFYPALRTVYREETSVLVDQWVVDCLVYTKHECRKAWARFSGRNDRRAILEAAVKEYLEYKLSYLYNGKYDFTVQVYKSIKEIDPSVPSNLNDEVSYVEHVRIKLVFPDTLRVLIFDIEVDREGSEA